MDKKKNDSGALKQEFLQTENLEEPRQSQDFFAKEENHKKQHEFTWAEKYQHKALKDFICHREIAEKESAGDVNHLIIEGRPGIGKRTMALAVLRENFGPDILKTRKEVLALDLESVLKRGLTSIIQIRALVSAKHIDVNLSESDMRGYELEVALLLIKETHNVLTKQHNLVNAKAIVFHQAEKISKNAQTQIRSFLEKSEVQHKVIFCCSDICKLQILKPLCRVIHLPPPSNKEIVGVLNFIAKQEDIELLHTLAETMAENSTHCLRQAIRSFEATWLADWEYELAIMAKSIIEEQSPNTLFLVRNIINLMEYHICQEFVLSNLVAELKKHVPDSETQSDIESLYHESATSKPNEDFWGERKSSYKGEVLANRMRNFPPFSSVAVEAKFMSYYKTKRVQIVSSLTGAAHQSQ